ncbi:Tfp pilus assembly protein, major pilin pila [Bacillus sp. OxB-1]|uniref:type IV pilus modification PilV family protein n=1 Tax=Bacillus sp. (strain OxB-1) TaxID=98228 RepID=UPI000582120A|nr:type II secretion system protein [Bacillus sp. OxB-1]BAQ11594.1 Tfp pilus assembly protein, major pilin pila [Bacillus sp. OxB-1]
MHKHNRLQSQKGLTLVEVLAAIVILGIFFVGFMTVLPQMTNFNTKTEDKLKTMNLAKKELAELKVSRDRLLEDDVNVSDVKDEEDNLKIKRFIYEESPYQYEVDYYIKPDLDGDDQSVYGNNIDGMVSLNKLHIKVKKKGKVISETYGYILE